MTKVNHDLRSNNGGTIYHLQETAGAEGQSNLHIPSVFEQDESALYPIGTRLVLGDRTFHYAHFTTAIVYANVGVLSYSGRDATYGQPDSYDLDQAAGTTDFIIDGTSANLPAANYYAGGYIFMPITGTLGRPTMRILSSTASAYTTAYPTVFSITLTLEQPTPVVIAANTTCDIFQNRYADVRNAWGAGSEMHAFVGVPQRLFTDEYYGWIQTWGPCFVVNTSTGLGNANTHRTACFNLDGSLEPLSETITNSEGRQIAGYTLAVNGAGSEWTYLMISP